MEPRKEKNEYVGIVAWDFDGPINDINKITNAWMEDKEHSPSPWEGAVEITDAA